MTKPFNACCALPPYFGGKRRLAPWIFNQLNRIYPQKQWHQMTFLDAFAGGGSMSLQAKAHGFKAIHSNDWSHRSQIVMEALLVNQNQTLSKTDLLWLTQPLPEDSLGPVAQYLVPHVFSTRHAQALDRLIYWAAQFEDLTKRNLARLLVWHLAQDFVCMPTSFNTSNRPYAETIDGLRDWQDLNPKRFTDGSFPGLLVPTWAKLEALRKRINAGVIGGSPVVAHQLEASLFLQQTTGDILYLDPPYAGSLNYESSLKTLDQVLFGKTGEQTLPVSTFSRGLDAIPALLSHACHVPVWILSYSNHVIELPDLVSLVKTQAGKRVVIGFEKAYQHLAHVSKSENRKELLILAYPQEVV
jgi:16S rRNA G966 N2-methylase RsmD